MIRRHWLKRRWFAEDIAAAMEMEDDGMPLWAIALAYSTTVENLGHQLTLARKHGFSGYPMRSSMKVFRLLPPPHVAGQDSTRFLRTLSLRA